MNDAERRVICRFQLGSESGCSGAQAEAERAPTLQMQGDLSIQHCLSCSMSCDAQDSWMYHLQSTTTPVRRRHAQSWLMLTWRPDCRYTGAALKSARPARSGCRAGISGTLPDVFTGEHWTIQPMPHDMRHTPEATMTQVSGLASALASMCLHCGLSRWVVLLRPGLVMLLGPHAAPQISMT